MALITLAELQFYLHDPTSSGPWNTFLQTVIDAETARMSLYLGWDCSVATAFGPNITYQFLGNNKYVYAFPFSFDYVYTVSLTEQELRPSIPATSIQADCTQVYPSSLIRTAGGVFRSDMRYVFVAVPRFFLYPVGVVQTSLLKSVCFELCALYVDASKRGSGTLGKVTDYNTVFDIAQLRIDVHAEDRVLSKIEGMKIGAVIM